MSVVGCRVERGEHRNFQVKIRERFARNIRNRETFVERNQPDIALRDELLVVLIRDEIFQNCIGKLHLGNHGTNAGLLDTLADEQENDIRVIRFAGLGEREDVFQLLRDSHVAAENDNKFAADSVFLLQVLRCGDERLDRLEVFQNMELFCGHFRIVFADVGDVALGHTADFVADAVKLLFLAAEMPIERPPLFHEAEIDGVLREDVTENQVGFRTAALFHACDDVGKRDRRGRCDDEVEFFASQMLVDGTLVNDGKEDVGNAFADEINPEKRE